MISEPCGWRRLTAGFPLILIRETRYAFRTRMLDYLWARLPIICSDGDFFADLVRQHGLGWVVAPEDEPDLVRALRAFGQRGEEYEAMRSRVGLQSQQP